MVIRWGAVQDFGDEFSLQHAVFQRVASVLDDGNDLSNKLVSPGPPEQFPRGRA